MVRITIIDDDIEFADNTAVLMRKQGYEVTTIYTTDKVVEALTENKPDLVILDVMFPDNPVAGFDVARKIHRTAALKQLPIILLTAVNQEFPMDFSAEDIDPNWMPVQDFVEKPVSIRRLMEAVRRNLSGKKRR